MSTTEAQDMITAAKESKKFLMEGMWTRYFPAFRKLEQMIKDGVIGDVVSLRGQFGFALKDRDVARLVQPDLGGGALMDIGIYLLSFTLGVFREYPLDVKAVAHFQGGVDWHDSIVLKFSKGIAVMDCGFDSDFYETQIKIVGTKGSVSVCHPFFAPTKLVVKTLNSTEEIYDFPPLKNNVSWNFSESVGLFHEVKYMHESLRAGKLESDLLNLNESLQTLRLTDEIRRQIGLVYPFEKQN
eukprot:TRINITY_DN833_c0_g2_i2.p1 TRINITY_DN833_c0_g2~~TRINITY_DN833_c0_g2_i2.p1  ORF type:complete len:241 (+),score=57.07 TRINITY_DN833_c0_g2_i2:449-1171(+)